jgi:hypothetical protein
MFVRAKSTRWPNSTRSATDALLALSILIAVAQFGLWNVSSTRDLDFNGFGLGSRPSDFVFQTETKSLPLTYANLDKTFNVERAQENGEGLSGPEYLSAGAIGGTL